MANVEYSQIRKEFFIYLITNGLRVFTFQSFKQWFFNYQLSKDKIKGFDNANIHRLIVRQLEKEGKVAKIRKGLWQVVYNEETYIKHDEIFNPKKKEDDFDRYLKNKLKKEPKP